jgi:hypothetical protein
MVPEIDPVPCDGGMIQIPMSSFNRLPNAYLESVALILLKKGNAVIIEDEEETRKHKQYMPLLPYTIADFLTEHCSQRGEQ